MYEKLPKAADFSGDNPPPRLNGFEDEYGLRRSGAIDPDGVIVRAGASVATDFDSIFNEANFDLVGLNVHKAVALATSPTWWLGNGGKLYKDGGLAEYGTPAVPGPYAATVAKRSGAYIIAKMIAASKIPVMFANRSATVHPQTGLIVTTGHHVSSLIPLPSGYTPETNVKRYTIVDSFSATALHTWGGLVTTKGYSLSQKVHGLGHPTGYSTCSRIREGEKPFAIVHMPQGVEKDEDICSDDFMFGRYENRAADSSTESSEFMSAGGISLLLRVIEHPHFTEENRRLEAMRLANPLKAMDTVSHDLTFTKAIELASGGTITAIQHQQELASIALATASQLELADDERLAADEWVRAYNPDTGVSTQDFFTHTGRMGAFAKLKAIADKTGGLDFSGAKQPQTLRWCLLWDLEFPAGPRTKYEEQNGLRITSDSDVKEAVYLPPAGSSASVRHNLINDTRTTINYLNWLSARFIDPQGVAVKTMIHPYRTEL